MKTTTVESMGEKFAIKNFIEKASSNNVSVKKFRVETHDGMITCTAVKYFKHN